LFFRSYGSPLGIVADCRKFRVINHATFAGPKFQPVTVPVQVIGNPSDFASPPTTIIEPSPVFAELRPTAPPPKARKPMRPKKPKPPKAAVVPNPAPAQPAAR
jgi:hypothetical protein